MAHWLRYATPAPAAAPNYYPHIFPYRLPPLVEFDPEPVPLDPAPAIWITDTTFRDGQQSRNPYSPQQIADLYQLLSRLGGPNGMIRQTEFFLYSRKDREAVERCLELDCRYPEITGWIRATPSDYAAVREMGLRETGILTSISDYHIYKKLRSDRESVLRSYLEVVDLALADGVVPRCHLEDSTRADFHHVVLPFVQALMERSRESGIQVKIRFPDTLGVGVPHPQAALPRGIPKLTYALRHEAGVPPEALEFHGQNDLNAIV
ncbi:MAG TPA: hypothetical protein VNL92_04970, partial [Dehalococcoidia bacterium]|nr:hypothetical protein [Dehalococcoidia bacterium]